MSTEPIAMRRSKSSIAINASARGKNPLQLEIRHYSFISGIQDVRDMDMVARCVSPYLRSGGGQVDGIANETETRLGKDYRPLPSGEQAHGAHARAA